MAEPKTSPRRVVARLKHKQALDLRIAGVTLDAIAKQLGYRSAQSASYAIDSELKRILTPPTAEMRNLELRRLDMMFLALMPKIRDKDVKAINTALRIMERRARYLGLDMPIPIDVSGKIQMEKLPDLSDKTNDEIKAMMDDVEEFLGINQR